VYSKRPEQGSAVSRSSAHLGQLERARLQRKRRLQLLARERAQLGPRGRREHVYERRQVRVRTPARGQRGELVEWLCANRHSSVAAANTVESFALGVSWRSMPLAGQ